LWPLIAALAVLQVLLALARFSAGVFLTGLPTVPGSLLELLAAASLIALAVQQDPIPGARQDWLVRPVARRDLFFAKLLFALVLVQSPWFATDLVQGLANGFSFGQSASAAAACAVWVLLTLTLPVLAFAALTTTLTETFVAALGVCAVVIGFLIVPGSVGATRPAALTGFAWVPSLLREVLLLVAAAGVLVLQYRWFQTEAAYALPARDGDQRMPGIGRCRDEAGRRGDSRAVSMSPGRRAAVVPLRGPRARANGPTQS
jgi:hypothetical protein